MWINYCSRRLARLANSPEFKSVRCPRWQIKFSLERFSDPSRIRLRAQPLESSLGRVPQAADGICNQTSKTQIVSVAEDCLSPERTFRGCSLMHFRGCVRGTSTCVPSRWKVLSGEFRRRPTELAIKFRKPDRVGRRGLSEPREDFSRLLTYAFPWLIPWHFNLRAQPLESSLGRVPQAAD